MLPELIDAKELASRVKVSVRTIRNWERDGVLPYIKVARLVRFNPADVAAALAQFEQGRSRRITGDRP